MFTSREIAMVVKQTRLGLNITQANLAMAAGTGIGFIKDLEAGKPTCEIQKVLTVLQALGIKVTLTVPLGNNPDQNLNPSQERAHGKRARRLSLRTPRRQPDSRQPRRSDVSIPWKLRIKSRCNTSVTFIADPERGFQTERVHRFLQGHLTRR